MDAQSFFLHYEWSGYTTGNFVAPFWSITPGGRPHLLYADLYDAEKHFCGTLWRFNMPLDTIRYLEKVIGDRTPLPSHRDTGQVAQGRF